MKRLILLVLLFTISLLQAQIVYIPDVNFKNALLNHTPIIDTNGDSQIQIVEAEIFTETLNIESKDISDLTGIESFINITHLNCRNNILETLILSNNTILEVLECDFNSITNLDITNNLNLIYLSCLDNELTSLVLTENNNLQTLNCYDNNLTDLFVPYSLEILRCQNNSLTELNLTNRTNLEYFNCDYNSISSLEIDGCNSLYQINAEANNLTTIDFSITGVAFLYLQQNNITSINVSNQPNLKDLFVGGNNISEIDLSHNHSLLYLSVEYNNLSEIDVSNNLYLKGFTCYHNNITSIDLSSHMHIEVLSCSHNNLELLDLRNGNNTNIWGFNSQYNPNLTCIYVDNATYCTDNWRNIDENSTFVETEEECNNLGIHNQQITDVSVYPNPVNDMLYIEFDNLIEEKSITIFNSLGKLVYSKKTKANKIDLCKLENGIYSLTIEINKRKINKIIVKIN